MTWLSPFKDGDLGDFLRTFEDVAEVVGVKTGRCIDLLQVTNSVAKDKLYSYFVVCETIGLREAWFFGLRFDRQMGLDTWLDLNKKVSKQLKSIKGVVDFYFRAKHYPENALSELIYEITQKLFYLQVKESILSGGIHCPLETAILLASYACQAKYGNYNPERLKSGFLKHERLLPKRLMDQYERDLEQMEAAILRWYGEHKNMLRADVMLEYLHIAQDLEMYGVTYFEIRNKRGTNLLLGVDAFGLNIYPDDNRLTPKLGFPWSEIANVRFKKHKFIIKPVDKSSRTLSFYSKHVKENQALLSLCVGTHEFYIRRRRQESIEVQHMRAQANAERVTKMKEKEKLASAIQAKEDAEQQLRMVEERLENETVEQQRARLQAERLARRVNVLERKLQKEKDRRHAIDPSNSPHPESDGKLSTKYTEPVEEIPQYIVTERTNIPNKIDDEAPVQNVDESNRVQSSIVEAFPEEEERELLQEEPKESPVALLTSETKYPPTRQTVVLREKESIEPSQNGEDDPIIPQTSSSLNLENKSIQMSPSSTYRIDEPRSMISESGSESDDFSALYHSQTNFLSRSKLTEEIEPSAERHSLGGEISPPSPDTEGNETLGNQKDLCFDLDYMYRDSYCSRPVEDEPSRREERFRHTCLEELPVPGRYDKLDHQPVNGGRYSAQLESHRWSTREQSQLLNRPLSQCDRFSRHDYDRFRTLRRIRRGNTKKRVDEFESM